MADFLDKITVDDKVIIKVMCGEKPIGFFLDKVKNITDVRKDIKTYKGYTFNKRGFEINTNNFKVSFVVVEHSKENLLAAENFFKNK